jgi:hypothetical protein
MRAANLVCVVALFVGCSCARNRAGLLDSALPVGGSAGTGGAAGTDAAGAIPDFLLYDGGNGLGSLIYGLHVDAEGVYWIQKDMNIYRGSRDGHEPAKVWGQIHMQFADTMTGDAQRLYWLEHEKLRFRDKKTGAEGEVLLPWDHTGGALAIDDHHVYAAMVGCPAVSRIDKQTLAREELDIPGIAVDPRGGGTTLVLQDGGFYCGSWGNVFWISGWGQAAKRLVSGAVRLAGLSPQGDRIFWLNDPGYGSTSRPYLSRLVVTTGELSDFPQEQNRGASNLVASPDGSWLFNASFTVLHAASTSDGHQVDALPADPEGSRTASYGVQIRTDGEALYYLADRALPDGVHHGVHRVPFSYLLQRVQQ